jgi:hypothetical protein
MVVVIVGVPVAVVVLVALVGRFGHRVSAVSTGGAGSRSSIFGRDASSSSAVWWPPR